MATDSILVQKSDPVHRHGYGSEGFFHPPFQKIGPLAIQHMAESVIGLGKEDGFIDTRWVLKGDEFHGLPLFGAHRLAGDLPADGSDLPPHQP